MTETTLARMRDIERERAIAGARLFIEQERASIAGAAQQRAGVTSEQRANIERQRQERQERRSQRQRASIERQSERDSQRQETDKQRASRESEQRGYWWLAATGASARRAAEQRVAGDFPTLDIGSLLAATERSMALYIGSMNRSQEQRQSIASSERHASSLARLVAARLAPTLRSGNGSAPALWSREAAQERASSERVTIESIETGERIERPLNEQEQERYARSLRQERAPGSQFGSWLDGTGAAPAQHGIPHSFADRAPGVPERETLSLARLPYWERIESAASQERARDSFAIVSAASESVRMTTRGTLRVDWHSVCESVGTPASSAAIKRAQRLTRSVVERAASDHRAAPIEPASSETRQQERPSRASIERANTRSLLWHSPASEPGESIASRAIAARERDIAEQRYNIEQEQSRSARAQRIEWLAGAESRSQERAARLADIEQRMTERGHNPPR